MDNITLRNYSRFFIKSTSKIFNSSSILGKLFLTVAVFVLSANGIPEWKNNNGKNFKSWTWEIVKENQPVFPGDFSHWSARAGLQALHHQGKFYIFGGRSPLPPPLPFGASIIHGDGWVSEDKGETWANILQSNPPSGPETHWPNRAYFQAVKKGKYMYILGGQNFGFPESDFFNDVWRSEDGIDWTQMTDPNNSASRWDGRAGLSAVVFKGYIYVMGGSQNDDCALLPPGSCIPGAPPPRKYYNDVWRSPNGSDWERVTSNAGWEARAGGIAVVKDGYMYMIGGENGFICFPGSPCPPYFNDVWRTKNGKDWELVTDDAGWDKRPGHQVVVAQNTFVLFGGFGLGADNGTTPSNPSDVWISHNGKIWKKVSEAPWNAKGSEDIKYDFDAFVVEGNGQNADEIFTFGGDRETFDRDDPLNYTKVDNDVWKFGLPEKKMKTENPEEKVLVFYPNYPNPFRDATIVKYYLPQSSFVSIKVYDHHGKFVSTLTDKMQNEGEYEISWNGKNFKGKPVNEGLYYATLWAGGKSKTIKLFKE